MSSCGVDFPLVLINLKTYKEAMSGEAVKLASMVEEASRRTGVYMAVSPQAVDLRLFCNSKLPVFAQHIDPVSYGKFTGHILPEAVVNAGCVGTLINHSERQIGLEVIEETVNRAKEVGLFSVVCVDSVEVGRAVAIFKPNAIAIEPPELIGTGISVSMAKPEVVSGAVEAIKAVQPGVKVMCGAGITSGRDVESALKLGSEGILVASGVVKAENPYALLLEFGRALRP